MTFQRLLCIFGIHKNKIVKWGSVDIADEDGDVVEHCQTVFYECECCHRVKRKILR